MQTNTVGLRLMDLDSMLLTVVSSWTLGASAVSLGLARFRLSGVNPALVAAASCPVALWFWFVNPWAIPLGAFTMVLLGHAMSRERRFRMRELRLPRAEQQGFPAMHWQDARAFLRRVMPFAVTIAIVIAALLLVASSFDDVVSGLIYDWRESLFGHYQWHWAWRVVMRTGLFWVSLIALAAVGYVVLRKVSPTMRAKPYVAAAVLVAVMLDALIQGGPHISHLSWSDLSWSPDLEKYIERGHHSFYRGPRLIIGDITGAPLGLSFGVAAVALIGFAWQAVRDTLAGYGGLLFGMAWIVVVFWLMEREVYFSHHYTLRISLNDLLLANLVIAALAMFATLYWCFGPGSVRTVAQRHGQAQGAT